MRKPFYILLGITLGIWSFLSIGTFLVVLIGIFTGLCFYKNALNNKERKFLTWVFFVAFCLSIIFSIFNFYLAALVKSECDLIGDAVAYSSHGAYIAEVLTNKKCNVETNYTHLVELNYCRNKYNGELPTYGNYRMGFFAYSYGAIYTLFGYSPLIMKFLNSIAGIVGCFLIYFMIRDVFGEKQARIALLLVLFWPSRFIWATTGLKDTLTFFAFSLVLFEFFRLQKYSNLFWTAIILLAAFINYDFAYALALLIIALFIFNREKMLSLLNNFILIKLGYILIYGIRMHFIGPLMLILIISLCTFLTRAKLMVLAVCLVMLSPFLLSKIDKNAAGEQYRYQTVQMITTHLGQVHLLGAKTKYKIYPSRFYDSRLQDSHISLAELLPLTFKELSISYLLGMGYYFLSPFPWFLSSKMQVIGYMQNICFYLLLPFILLGIIIGVRYHWRETFPYFLLIFAVATINALFAGNIGTLFRHRDMVMPFFIAFAAVGLIRIFGLAGLHRRGDLI